MGQKEDESLKFVWAYMIENGVLTDGNWSYYGGHYEYLHNDWRKSDAAMKKLREDVKKYGVDWEKTIQPQTFSERAFTDTFHDSDDVETLLGTVYLKDGSNYLIGCNDSDLKFSQYVKILAELAQDRQRVKDILGE